MDINAFWNDVLKQNRDRLGAYFCPEAVIRWHCTDEQFSVEEFIRVNCDYPGEWDGEIERVEQHEDSTFTAVRVFPVDRSASYHVVSFFTLRDNKIAALDEYWADDGDAPEWRKEMGVGSSIHKPLGAEAQACATMEFARVSNVISDRTFSGNRSIVIICYEERYRDDMIFMVLQAKDALGRLPRINEDLLDIQKNYLDRGDGFWLALDDADRVIGCVGFSRTPNTTETFLHRLYVKASEKRKGVGTALLHAAEEEMRRQGITVSRVHLGEPREQWFESYSFYPKHGYHEYQDRYMARTL